MAGCYRTACAMLLPMIVALLALFACNTPEETPEPPAPPAPPPAVGVDVVEPPPGFFALLAASGEAAIPVACLAGGEVQGGADCTGALAGLTAVMPRGTGVLGEAVEVRCEPSGKTTAGHELRYQDGSEGSGRRWGHVGSPVARGFIPATDTPADGAALAAALAALPPDSGWPMRADDPEPALFAQLTLPDERQLLRIQAATADPDKPPRSAMLLRTPDGTLSPLPADGLSLNGHITAAGLLPLPGDSALLVLRSRWMGGSGLHAITVSGEDTAVVGEWACGS